METFHEVLPDNLVFFHFYYIGTKEIELLDYAIEFYVKKYINAEKITSGGDTLDKTVSDQAVCSHSGTPILKMSPTALPSDSVYLFPPFQVSLLIISGKDVVSKLLQLKKVLIPCRRIDRSENENLFEECIM